MTKLLVIWFFEWLWCLSNLIMKPRMLTYDRGLKREIKLKHFDVQAYENSEKKNFTIKSDFDYMISCELMEAANKANKKIAILCHGFGRAKYDSIKYALLFQKLGFTVLMYDHRNHGQSGKAFTTMGHYEKYDLKKIVDWCIEQYGSECRIVTHGESMGAATVILHLGIDKRVKCAISDCGYSDLKLLLCHQMKEFYHLPKCFIPVESCMAYLRAGFRFKDVSPIKIVSQIDTPILFIHGKCDNLVPPSMSKQMYAAKKTNKAIYLVAKAKHAQSYWKNGEEYERRVEKFLNTYL